MRRLPVNVVEGGALVALALTVLGAMAARGFPGGVAAGILWLVGSPGVWVAAYAVVRRLPPVAGEGGRRSRGLTIAGLVAVVTVAALALRLVAAQLSGAAPWGIGPLTPGNDRPGPPVTPGSAGSAGSLGPLGPLGLQGALPWPAALAVALVLYQARRRDAALRSWAGGLLLGIPAVFVAGAWGGPPIAEAAGALFWLTFGLFNAVYSERARLGLPPSLAAILGDGAGPAVVPGRDPHGLAEARGFDRRAVRIVISGFYGGGNAGDEAILASLLAGLRARGYEDITVFSIRPEETARRYGVASVYRGWRRHLWAKARALARAHVFISGGGGLLQDTTPTFLLRGPVPYYLLIATWARLLGCWVLFLGQGVGPLRGRWARFLTRLLANQADVITVRDAESLHVMEVVGVTRPPRLLTADFVFAAPPPDRRRGEELAVREGLDPGARRIVVSVRTWPGRERFYPELAAFLEGVLARDPDLQVVLVPMEGELDRAASEELASYLEARCASRTGSGSESPAESRDSGPGRTALAGRVKVMNAGYDPADLEAFVAGSWLAVGMRLHFLLFAARAGVPVLALAYDPKVAGAMARLGMSRYVFALEEVRAAALLAAYDELVTRYDEVRQALKQRVAALEPLAAANLDFVDETAARALHLVERAGSAVEGW